MPDRDYYLYVVDRYNNRIQKLLNNGNFILEWGSYGTGDGEFNYPQKIAIDSTGNVYVADTGNDRIQKFNPDGVFIRKWGSTGTGNGQFSAPTAIFITAADIVCVADCDLSAISRIQRFNVNGDYLGQSGSFEARKTCTYLGKDGSGNVYAIESGTIYMLKFDADGNFLLRFSLLGSSVGNDITITSNSICVRVSNTIKIYDLSGVYVSEWPTGTTFRAWLASDSSSNIYVTRTATASLGGVRKYAFGGTVLASWGLLGSTDGKLNAPQGIVVDSTNSVYVVDRGNSRIQKFDAVGNFILKWGSSGTGNNQFSAPTAIEVDANDNVYVLDGVRIQKFNSSGTFIASWVVLATDSDLYSTVAPVDIVVRNNALCVSENGGNNYILEYDLSGNFVQKWETGPAASGGFLGASAIVEDASGNFYLQDEWGERILVFDSSWAFLRAFDTSYGQGVDLARGADGTLYVLNYSARTGEQIFRFDSNGTYLGKFGVEAGTSGAPLGIVVLGDNKYVTMNGFGAYNDRVLVYNSSNALASQFGGGGTLPGEFDIPYDIAAIMVAVSDNKDVRGLITTSTDKAGSVSAAAGILATTAINIDKPKAGSEADPIKMTATLTSAPPKAIVEV